jgi:hypothetical protein
MSQDYEYDVTAVDYASKHNLQLPKNDVELETYVNESLERNLENARLVFSIVLEIGTKAWNKKLHDIYFELFGKEYSK